MAQASWPRRVLKALTTLAFACGGGLVFLRWFEQRNVFQPSATLWAGPDALGRPFEEVWLNTSDGERLHAWFFPAATNAPRRQLVVLHCHGNGGNLSHRLELFSALLSTGVNVLGFDYRGYGQSSGRPSETGTYLDAQAAYAWLRRRGFVATNIVAHGESLGGAVAAELAVREPVGGLVLQSTFTSIADIGSEKFPWLPVRRLSRIHYDTLAKLPGLHVPVLVMHSRTDTLVGFHHSERLFAAANEPKLFREVAGDHNETLEAGPRLLLDGFEALFRIMEPPRARADAGRSDAADVAVRAPMGEPPSTTPGQAAPAGASRLTPPIPP